MKKTRKHLQVNYKIKLICKYIRIYILFCVDDQLIMICLDLFIAGANTTSQTLNFILLMMLLHPDVQEKAFHAVNSSLDPNEPLLYVDRVK